MPSRCPTVTHKTDLYPQTTNIIATGTGKRAGNFNRGADWREGWTNNHSHRTLHGTEGDVGEVQGKSLGGRGMQYEYDFIGV